MNYHRLLLPLAGLMIAGAQHVEAQTTITFNNVRVFQNTTTMTSVVGGVPSTGTLVVQPGAALFPNANTGVASWSAPLRLESLDLDGVGGNDDYIDFNLQFDAARDSGPLVNLTGAGTGVNGDFSTGTNEQLTVSVVVTDVSVAGWASMDGFTAAALYLGGSNIVTSGQADVNGTTVSINNDYTGLGFQFAVVETALSGFPSTAVINNITATDGDFRLREVDFSITYDPNGTPPPPAPVVLTSNDLNLRPDAFFVYPNINGPNQGGTNAGEIVGQPGFDATMVTGSPITDFPLRWSQLDLDGVGVNDDYIDFTIRATAVASLENVTFQGEGFGIAAGGSFGLDAGEQLSFEVVGISLSPGTAAGTVSFNGFSEGGFFGSGSAGAGLATTGDAECDINGNSVMLSLNGTGYTSGTVRSAFALTNSVTFDMPSYTAGTVTPVGRARDFDLQFTYQEGAVAPADLKVDSVVFASPNLTITTGGVIDGETYHAEYSPDLQTAFTPVSGSDEAATSGQVVHTINVGSATEGFYRIAEGAAPAP